MTGLRPGGFERSLHALDREELAAFVGELWGAGGWETDVEGALVVAERSGHRRRIGVVAAGRGLDRLRRRTPVLGDAPVDELGTDTLGVDDLDVVVDASGSGRVATAAGAADAEYVPPAALRDRLLYGVPRAEGAALSELFLDGSLDRMRGQSADGPPAGFRALLLVGVVAVLVGALAAGPLGAPSVGPGQPASASDAVQSAPDGRPSPTATARAAPTATAAVEAGTVAGTTPEPPNGSSYPPGLSSSGVENVSALVDSHAAATRDSRYAVDVRFDGPAAATGFGDFESVRWTLVVERRNHFRVDATYRRANDAEPRWISRGIYADAVTVYERTVTPNGTRYGSTPARAHDPEAYRSVAPTAIGRYLDATATVVRPVGSPEGPRYHVVAGGTPARLNDSVVDYRAEALVTPRGRVTALEARYTIQVDGTERRVQVGFDYRDYGRALVDSPDWYDQNR